MPSRRGDRPTLTERFAAEVERLVSQGYSREKACEIAYERVVTQGKTPSSSRRSRGTH